jgi:hypothetical protein
MKECRTYKPILPQFYTPYKLRSRKQQIEKMTSKKQVPYPETYFATRKPRKIVSKRVVYEPSIYNNKFAVLILQSKLTLKIHPVNKKGSN